MPVQELTQDNIDSIITENPIVIIDFWASWCGPCQTFKPIFEEASDRHSDITFVACNTEEQRELAETFQVRSIPTTVVFKEQVAVFGQPGMMTGEILDDLLGKVRELNMEEVRAEISKQEVEKDGSKEA
ncbi:MAG: thioredoxin fold domain-containing protein [bacterium]|nr:thioredoxin fold domain-containing protein [bacterium]